MNIQSPGRFLIPAATLVAAAMVSAPAFAQNIGEEGGYQFRTPAQTQVLGSNLSLIELQKSGYYDQFKGGAIGAANGATGSGGSSTTGFAASASLTNNFYQVYNNTVNNCASSGPVGAPITCGSGAVSSSGTSLSTSGSTVSTANTVSGNTLTQSANPSTTNTTTIAGN